MTIELLWGWTLLVVSAISIMWVSVSDKVLDKMIGVSALSSIAGLGVLLWEPFIKSGYQGLMNMLPPGDEGLRIITAILLVFSGYILSLVVWGAVWYFLPDVVGPIYRKFVTRNAD